MIGPTGPVPGPSPNPDVVTLRFLHTNDMHGTLAPLKDTVLLGHPAELGGAAYLATLVNTLRAEAPDRTLVLDAGDAVHGQAASDLSEGVAMAEVMNAIGYDAATVGNHDPVWGVEAMERRLDRCEFPNVVANVSHDDGTLLANTAPYAIFDLDGVKVGVLGLLTPETVEASREDCIRGLRFDDEQEAIEHYLPEMRAKGADVAIMLTHDGLARDMVHANDNPDQDLLFIGGHSHSRTPDAIRMGGNHIVQAGSQGRELGVLEVDFDRSTRRIVDVRHTLVPVDTSVLSPDPDVQAIVDRYQREADEKMGRVVADLPGPYTRTNSQDSLLGNLVTDAMRIAAEADVAIMNSSGLRCDLPEGEVTVRGLYEVMPFGGELVKGTIRGQELMEVLERSAAYREPDAEVQSPFLQVSGVRFEYDADRPEGQRVVSAEVRGVPVEAGQTYSIAMEDFLAQGKDGYDGLGRVQCQDVGQTIIDAVGSYLENHALQPGPEQPRIMDRTPETP